jgi:hypothetical protein
MDGNEKGSKREKETKKNVGEAKRKGFRSPITSKQIQGLIQKKQNRCVILPKNANKVTLFSQCCGSGFGIQCLFDPWIQYPG